MEIPSTKDGFLATNSLLAFSVLLVRAYARIFSIEETLPKEFEALLADESSGNQYLQNLREHYAPLLNCGTLIVLHSASVSSAAVDLESKFSEAALGNIQLSDFRNFAHGRHHWLAKYQAETGVLAIFTDNERELAERTLRLIPQNVPMAKICLPMIGPTANVPALVAIFHLVGAAGEKRGIDPGRPGVPLFGRRIYSSRALRTLLKGALTLEAVAIARKLNCDVESLQSREDVNFWKESYAQFIEALQGREFAAIVFDYDGTLCDEKDRFTGLRSDVVRHLSRLLRANVAVGIATGRGKSVRNDIRKVLPEDLWDRVYLGYYNGSDSGILSDDYHPDPATDPSGFLKEMANVVSSHPIISHIATFELRRAQLSVLPKSVVSAELIWRILQPLAQSHGLVALRSSHSIDLFDRTVSKRSLLIHLRNLVPECTQVLLIGDKGLWPGNDYDLLSEPYSLSVDEVSVDPNTCWNVAPPGHRGVQATLDYLSWIQLEEGRFRLVIPCPVSDLS
jgi:hypothetical protein